MGWWSSPYIGYHSLYEIVLYNVGLEKGERGREKERKDMGLEFLS